MEIGGENEVVAPTFLGAHTIVPIDKTGDAITTLAVSVLGVLRRAVKALLRLRVKPEAVLNAMWAHKGAAKLASPPHPGPG